MKKRQKKASLFSIILGLFVLVFISIHFISAYDNPNAIVQNGDYCQITNVQTCESITGDSYGNLGNIILSLASSTDSHGGLFAYSPSYNYVLCCYFPSNGKGVVDMWCF